MNHEVDDDGPKLIGLDLGAISPGGLKLLLIGEISPAFFQEVLDANRARPEILEIVRVHPGTPTEIREAASTAMSLPVPLPRELEIARREQEEEEARPEPERKQSLFQQISKMKTGERMLLARRGGQQVRSMLLKDNNKEVVRMVLQNPKLSDSEVDLISKNRNISDDVLRIVSKNREWMKNYSIVHGLVTNPKTPPGIAANLVLRINKADLKMISTNRNISELVRAAAKRQLAPKKKRD